MYIPILSRSKNYRNLLDVLFTQGTPMHANPNPRASLHLIRSEQYSLDHMVSSCREQGQRRTGKYSKYVLCIPTYNNREFY